jgi:hypothetical protein
MLLDYSLITPWLLFHCSSSAPRLLFIALRLLVDCSSYLRILCFDLQVTVFSWSLRIWDLSYKYNKNQVLVRYTLFFIWDVKVPVLYKYPFYVQYCTLPRTLFSTVKYTVQVRVDLFACKIATYRYWHPCTWYSKKNHITSASLLEFLHAVLVRLGPRKHKFLC